MVVCQARHRPFVAFGTFGRHPSKHRPRHILQYVTDSWGHTPRNAHFSRVFAPRRLSPLRRAIGPKDVAAHLGVSRPLIDLRFRELLKTSVGRTIETERMNAVCTELSSGHYTIKEIAEHCDYADASQLMHRFKRHFGMTMRDWRKQQIAPKPSAPPWQDYAGGCRNGDALQSARMAALHSAASSHISRKNLHIICTKRRLLSCCRFALSASVDGPYQNLASDA